MTNATNGTSVTDSASAEAGSEKLDKGKEKEGGVQTKKFRGVPENVKLFEVFWEQVVELVKVRSISLITSVFHFTNFDVYRLDPICRYKTSLRCSCLSPIFR